MRNERLQPGICVAPLSNLVRALGVEVAAGGCHAAELCAYWCRQGTACKPIRRTGHGVVEVTQGVGSDANPSSHLQTQRPLRWRYASRRHSITPTAPLAYPLLTKLDLRSCFPCRSHGH